MNDDCQILSPDEVTLYGGPAEIARGSERLHGRLVPIKFSLEQDSNARVEHSFIDPDWRSLSIGMDDVKIEVEAVFIPLNSPSSPEFSGVDHLPCCLKVVLPLYQWVLVSMRFETREFDRNRRFDLYTYAEFVGTKL